MAPSSSSSPTEEVQEHTPKTNDLTEPNHPTTSTEKAQARPRDAKPKFQDVTGVSWSSPPLDANGTPSRPPINKNTHHDTADGTTPTTVSPARPQRKRKLPSKLLECRLEEDDLDETARKWNALKRVTLLMGPSSKRAVAATKATTSIVKNDRQLIKQQPKKHNGDDKNDVVHGTVSPKVMVDKTAGQHVDVTNKKEPPSRMTCHAFVPQPLDYGTTAPPPKHAPIQPTFFTTSPRMPCEVEIEKCKYRPRFLKALHTWYQRYNELVDYKRQYGHCLVPQKYEPAKELGIWVNKMREEKKRYDEGQRSILDKYKIKALEDIDFTWARKKGDELWERRFQELLQFRTKYGRDPGTKVSGIGRWVSTQRCHYKQNILSAERIARLEAVGFLFNAKDNHHFDEDDPLSVPKEPIWMEKKSKAQAAPEAEKTAATENGQHPVKVDPPASAAKLKNGGHNGTERLLETKKRSASSKQENGRHFESSHQVQQKSCHHASNGASRDGASKLLELRPGEILETPRPVNYADEAGSGSDLDAEGVLEEEGDDGDGCDDVKAGGDDETEEKEDGDDDDVIVI